jgi:hypothetical protein
MMPLLTIGQAFSAKVHLIAWCKKCLHRFEPDTAAWLNSTAQQRL